MLNYKIVSDGLDHHTKVFVNIEGKWCQLPGVVNVGWSIKVKDFARANLEVVDVELGEVPNVE
jgi:hypothetical protein